MKLRFQILIILITLVACFQPRHTDKAENFCSEYVFDSKSQQADSLLFFMHRSTQTEGILKTEWERKFFCAFPSSFTEMEDLFGFHEINGPAPLYNPENASGKYMNKQIFSNAIGFFNELNSISPEAYYTKYVNINIEGNWQADNIREAFGFHYKLLSDTEASCSTLSKFSDKEIQSVFRFIFDGPHPANRFNEDLYGKLLPLIDSHDVHLSLLLSSSYNQLVSEDHSH